MPTYSYQCKKCSHTFDVFHAMSATPLIKCEACGGRTERLLGTGSGLIFKGSGFYETDFKEKKGTPDKAPEKSGDSSKGDSGKSDAGKSDSGKSDSGKSDSSSSKSSETPKGESKKKDGGKAAPNTKKNPSKS